MVLFSCGGGGGGGSSASFDFDQSNSPKSWNQSVLPLTFSFANNFEGLFGDMTFTVSVIEAAWKTRVPNQNPIIYYNASTKIHPNSNNKSDYYSTPPQSIGIYSLNNTQWTAMNMPPSALAVTIYTLSSTTGYMTKAAILLNNGSGYQFSSIPEIALMNHYDLPTILTHEIGHILGLSHIGSALDPNNENIMKAALGPGETRRTAQSEEIQALINLYPSTLTVEEEEKKEEKEEEDEEVEGWIALMPDGTCLHFH